MPYSQSGKEVSQAVMPWSWPNQVKSDVAIGFENLPGAEDSNRNPNLNLGLRVVSGACMPFGFRYCYQGIMKVDYTSRYPGLAASSRPGDVTTWATPLASGQGDSVRRLRWHYSLFPSRWISYIDIEDQDGAMIPLDPSRRPEPPVRRALNCFWSFCYQTPSKMTGCSPATSSKAQGPRCGGSADALSTLQIRLGPRRYLAPVTMKAREFAVLPAESLDAPGTET
ncbi:hypothetical protein VTN00DRAFT_6157 [Thermoascus crustaceus]|uniref:uncharacterized protein n=1 Tax=Thermoascus crustaceus TaxID=5088 RepID=UPI003742D78B